MSRVVYKGKQPRSNVLLCWICGRLLYGGGHVYEIVTDEAGNDHPAHKSCASKPEARG